MYSLLRISLYVILENYLKTSVILENNLNPRKLKILLKNAAYLVGCIYVVFFSYIEHIYRQIC